MITKQAWHTYIEPEIALKAVERLKTPLICLAGSGRHIVLALAGKEIDYAVFAAQVLQLPQHPISFATGYLGLLSYDGFAPTSETEVPHRVFHIYKSLVWDRVLKTLTIYEDDNLMPTGIDPWIDDAQLNRVFENASGPHSLDTNDLAPIFIESEDPSGYVQMVADAVEHIRAGDYYQINLLRYFSLRNSSFARLLEKALTRGGSHALVLRCAGLELVSLSPEQFVTAGYFPEHQGEKPYNILTRPIKGTAARGENAAEDLHQKNDLDNSPKERAELAMIIDLLRNDLHRVCIPHSVDVLSSGHIETLPYVFHRVGVIGGKIRPQLQMGELLDKLMPGGSITGAPKRAAMTAIKAFEGRDRGYFMGTAFCYDPRGYFDSSILIRTAYRTDVAKDFEFAAGSGIVLMSEPAKESRECELKCRVLSDDLTQMNQGRTLGESGNGISHQ